MNAPKISFICPSYNHERFIDRFFASVLAQTCPDWEMIIVDDHSTDKNVEHIKAVNDPRIRLIVHECNRGINVGLNDALPLARAPICSFVDSDDELKPTYIEEVLQGFAENPQCDIGCVQLAVIDEKSCETGDVVGVVPEEAKDEVFGKLFLWDWEFLVWPGLSVRTDLLRKIFPLPEGLLQCHDYSAALNMVYESEAFFLKKNLVRYRKCGQGISNVSKLTLLRYHAELPIALDINAAKIKTEADLRKHFGWAIKLPDETIPTELIPFWIGRAALTSRSPERVQWGLRQIIKTMNQPELGKMLREMYGYDFKAYLTGLSAANLPLTSDEKKLRRYRNRLKAMAILSAALSVICLGLLAAVFA